MEILRTVKEALQLEARNGNKFWNDAIDREMVNLKVAFDILENDTPMTPGYKRSSGHMIFDVRMTLERKAIRVKDGHRTP